MTKKEKLCSKVAMTVMVALIPNVFFTLLYCILMFACWTVGPVPYTMWRIGLIIGVVMGVYFWFDTDDQGVTINKGKK